MLSLVFHLFISSPLFFLKYQIKRDKKARVMLSPSSSGQNPNLLFNQAGFPVGVNSSDYCRAKSLGNGHGHASRILQQSHVQVKVQNGFFPVSPWGWADGPLCPCPHRGHSKPWVTDTHPTVHCPPGRSQNFGKRAVLPPAEGTGNLCFLFSVKDPLELVQVSLAHSSCCLCLA